MVVKRWFEREVEEDEEEKRERWLLVGNEQKAKVFAIQANQHHINFETKRSSLTVYHPCISSSSSLFSSFFSFFFIFHLITKNNASPKKSNQKKALPKLNK